MVIRLSKPYHYRLDDGHLFPFPQPPISSLGGHNHLTSYSGVKHSAGSNSAQQQRFNKWPPLEGSKSTESPIELFSVHLPPQRITPAKKHIHFNDFTNCPLSFNPISSGIVLFSRLLIRNIFSRWCLKGTVQWDFGPLVFLHNLKLPTYLTTDEWIKYFFIFG